MSEMTQLLNAAVAGDANARDQVMDLLYDELKRLAHSRIAPQCRSDVARHHVSGA